MAESGIIDRLAEKVSNGMNAEELGELESIIPKRCIVCKTNILCTLIPTFINIAKAGITLTVDFCPCYNEMK